MTTDDKKKFIVNILFIIAVYSVLYFVFKYVVKWFMPFIIGFLIAFALKPITEAITKITGIKRKGVPIIVLGMFYSVLVIIIWFLVSFLWNQTAELVRILPSLYFNRLEPILFEANDWIVENAKLISPDVADTLSSIIASGIQYLATIVRNISVFLVSSVTGILSNIPLYLISVIFTIVLSVFISVDYKNISSFIKKQLPNDFNVTFAEARKFLFGTLLKMIKAYAIILSITFIEMLIGLSILNVRYPLPIAAIVAILDILPLIGTGGILIPWAIVELVLKNYTLGIGLIALYLIITIVRNTIEPKIVGEQIGLHPIVTITVMYAGLRLFGFSGFIIAPIIAILVKYLNDNGKIHIIK
ncbi:MAG: sporulation integral membrane protein YtvI [Tissierellia bacterium]|nr:sporulation integral membrane protein YtvI [Tissierellia bacterium]MDD4779387.1 sporulation integral membrane protein YtvI [Tissierellia bacterium]